MITPMKLKYLVLMALGFMAAAPLARAEATRMTNPNSVNVEIFGKSLRYGLGYDRAVNDDLAVGFEIGSVNMNSDADVETTQNATMVSPFVNYYFQRDQSSVYVTAGAALVTNVNSVKDLKTGLGGLKLSGNALVPQFGIGYENRGDSGFLFRMAFYGMIDRNVIPWVGFTLGYAF